MADNDMSLCVHITRYIDTNRFPAFDVDDKERREEHVAHAAACRAPSGHDHRCATAFLFTTAATGLHMRLMNERTNISSFVIVIK